MGRTPFCLLVSAVLVLTMSGCSGGEPTAESAATDPDNAPRGGDMVSTNMRARARAVNTLEKANAQRQAEVDEVQSK